MVIPNNKSSMRCQFCSKLEQWQVASRTFCIVSNRCCIWIETRLAANIQARAMTLSSEWGCSVLFFRKTPVQILPELRNFAEDVTITEIGGPGTLFHICDAGIESLCIIIESSLDHIYSWLIFKIFCPFVQELMRAAIWWFVSSWFGRSLL